MIQAPRPARPAKPGSAKPSSATEPGLVALWRARLLSIIETGIGQLTDPKLTAARQVQKGRQATKAARALLRLAPPGLRRQARGLTMALGTVRRLLAETRDTDALIETLTRVAEAAKLSKPALAALAKPLRARRVPLGRLQVDEAAQAVAMLQKIADRIGKLALPKGGDAALIDAAVKEYRKLRREARPGLDRLHIEDLHDLRKRAISHRHQVAFLAAVAPADHKARLAARVARAKVLHEAIGKHRDLELLGDFLRPSKEAGLHAERKRLLEEIAHQQDIELKQAMQTAERLTRARPKRLTRGISPASR